MNRRLFSQDFLCGGIRETFFSKNQNAAAIVKLGAKRSSYFASVSIETIEELAFIKIMHRSPDIAAAWKLDRSPRSASKLL